MTDAQGKQEPWVPMAKDLARLLPVDRGFTEIEAVYSLQLDHNNGKNVSVMGYAKLWGWTRDKVAYFLKRCGLIIEYPADTKQTRNQSGKLSVGFCPTYLPAKKPHIKFIDFRQLQDKTHIKPAYQPALLTRKEKEGNDTCPHQDIISLYHEILPELRKVKKWTPKRQAQLRARWREEKKHQNLDWWRRYFEYVRESSFLMGENNPWLDLEWLTNQGNMVKVIEGKYHGHN